MEEMRPKRAEQPELQIVPVEKQPEVSIVPPQVVEEIIANIDREEKDEKREEDKREEEIERIKKPRLN